MTELLNIDKDKKLYMKVYHYYRRLIEEGRLSAGSRIPSVRKSSEELGLSRTTIENAYFLLAADGYLIARAGSGYYVSEIAGRKAEDTKKAEAKDPILYDLSSSGADRDSFRFDLWQRYMKSALRHDDRMLSYGDPQGEADLRLAISDYIREHRNIQCQAEDLVIGAGTQNLLQLLCSLMEEKKNVSFPTRSFVQGASVFRDYGFEITYRNKDAKVIYVSPAHMTKWGEIMPVKRRLELLAYAKERGSLIIEDDFENEFVYLQKPTPSLYSLSGGEGVVYLGSFSRLLLPSIRLSFMVLPGKLLSRYNEKKDFYNQTASLAEQIALMQFIRDGQLASQTRRLKKLYRSKLDALISDTGKVFGKDALLTVGSAGTGIALTLPKKDGSPEGRLLKESALKKGLRLKTFNENDKSLSILLSCSYLPREQFLPALELLYSLIY